MGLKPEKLAEIETVTLSHYNQNAEAFWHGTKDHDVTQNYAAFLAPFPKDKKLDILDLGCGPGRDVNYFQSLGHRPVGLDGSEAFCGMARKLTGCEILQQTFLNLDLPSDAFDGIFANVDKFTDGGGDPTRVSTLYKIAKAILGPELDPEDAGDTDDFVNRKAILELLHGVKKLGPNAGKPKLVIANYKYIKRKKTQAKPDVEMELDVEEIPF